MASKRDSGGKDEPGREPGAEGAESATPRPDGAEPGRPTSAAIDWRTLHLWQIQPVRDVLGIALVIGLLYVGYLIRVVTVPILLAMALAYLFEPVIKWLTRHKRINRTGAATIIIVGGALLIIAPIGVGLGFAVAQGVSAAESIARTAGRVSTVINASETLGSGLNDQGEFVGFKYPPTDEPGLSDQEQVHRKELAKLAKEGDAAYGSLKTNSSFWQRVLRFYMKHYAAAQTEAVRGAAQKTEETTFGKFLSIPIEWLRSNAESIGKRAVGTGLGAAQALIRGVAAIGFLVFTGFLTVFFFFFFCTGWGKVLDFWNRLIPEAKRHRVIDLVQQMDVVVAGFVRGRVTIALILMAYYTIAYTLIGAPASLIIGPIVGLLCIVPYASLVGIPITMIGLAMAGGGGFESAWWWIVFAPIVAYALGQILDDWVLNPLIQGKATNMDTPMVLFASIAGGALAGVYGVLLAIPVAACWRILMREVFWPKFREWAEGRARDFLPISRE